MPEHNYRPAYLRYLKARLSNFLRPSFWGTGFFLVAVGLVVRAYWLNPDIFTQQPNQESKQEAVEKENTKTNADETALSEEDKAIAADIDNMPTLLSDFAEATLPTITINYESNTSNTSITEKENSPIFVEDVINQQTAAANEAQSNSSLTTVINFSPTGTKNPFLVQAQNLLKYDKSNTGNQFLGINNLTTSPEKTAPTTTDNLAIGLTNQNTNNQNTLIVSPLETAIKQSVNTNQISPLDINRGVRLISPTNSLPNQGLPSSSRMGYIQPTVKNQPPKSYTNYTNFNNIQTAPNASITTTEVNSTSNNPYLVQPPIQGVVNTTTPVGYGKYSNNTVQQPGQLPQSNLSYPGQVQQGNNGFPR